MISLLILKSVFSVGFLKTTDVQDTAKETYNLYIDTVIQYTKLFKYTGDVQSILNLPYPLLQDLILAKIKDQKEENEALTKSKQGNTTYDLGNRF